MGGSILAASSATAPNVSVRPVGAWVIVPFCALHCDAGTFQRAAAAAMSISRAVAPARRRYSCEDAIDLLAPVDKSPQMRPRRKFCRGETKSVRIADQSHCSSSATSMARPVIAPWPISARATRMVTRLSGEITNQQVISGGEAPWALAVVAPGMGMPSASPLPAAALPIRNERRSSSPEFMDFLAYSSRK